MTGHVVLLGDSIFDNAVYVPGGPSVTQHLGRALPKGWRVTNLAVDGATTLDVGRQLPRVPADGTHVVMSIGGNDALSYASVLLNETADSFAEVLTSLADIQQRFRSDYQELLKSVIALRRPLVACTIYDSMPGFRPLELTGLSIFNDAIIREAISAAVPLIDLRLVCSESTDYAGISPIEPSASGGGKIARAIAEAVTTCDFEVRRTTVFW